ncbi:hypothetical protein AtNW77_Chr3g0162891 [Arabidopsis thaliana]|jgi:uncharacterized protein (TIGR01615 family)|uniref:Uncharacterized protein n=3 Tax=Arabidopsis TaxID=3701 RepID=A0A384KVM9_ARATH|nr:sulfate/thiosulfate import ATP-binding protein, putative (DUF506) [Arabidopsis thaliana]KAG7624383.1 PDDEXK-like [Arabidopsis thaliana x Arabidopsis arenosa]AAF02145.1 unknown protein [Arabidopsis thaliana]AAK76612.1 unknown protein [Arabidopsis thaliana]AAM44916.1 unknown protein [Arabidopsis thaliana]AEE74531.1 sulfate/thiosulfate import ATP-binding protein, putative (DUF506) [Arabidopsis thaliana]|eukprot:NP_566303.1 sulfate/thiosulfate import ATP-binding protein, putative (DUF506) [Arabidopsis thaliana]
MGFSRAKRVTDPLAEEVRARLVGCSFSSGSEHTGDGIEDYEDDDSPCLSDLVQGFLEDEVDTVDDESCWCDQDSGSDSDSDSELGELPDFADDIAKLLRNSLREDSYGRTVLVHVARAMEMLSSLGSQPEQRAVFQRKVMSLLRELGHNAAICKTKWKSSGGLTAGNHEFIDVVYTPSASSQSVRFIVDLDFSSRFQIARPTSQYARVLQSLPAVFVGKGDDLKRILRLVCDAARISLRNRGLTLPPWRKNRYMQTRWLGPYKRTTNLTPSTSGVDTVMCRAIGFDNAVGGRLFVRTR